MDYKNKYLKYKLKYLNLKKKLRGGMHCNDYISPDMKTTMRENRDKLNDKRAKEKLERNVSKIKKNVEEHIERRKAYHNNYTTFELENIDKLEDHKVSIEDTVNKELLEKKIRQIEQEAEEIIAKLKAEHETIEVHTKLIKEIEEMEESDKKEDIKHAAQAVLADAQKNIKVYNVANAVRNYRKAQLEENISKC